MGSSKHDPRAYPWDGSGNERDTRKLFAVFERLTRDGQDNIIAAAWAMARSGRNPLDCIAEALSLLSRSRLATQRDLARYIERHAEPMIVLRAGDAPPAPRAAAWSMSEDQATAAALAHPEPGSGAAYLARMRPAPPPGRCDRSPGGLHQLVVRDGGELVIIECGVCRALSPDSD